MISINHRFIFTLNIQYRYYFLHFPDEENDSEGLINSIGDQTGKLESKSSYSSMHANALVVSHLLLCLWMFFKIYVAISRKQEQLSHFLSENTSIKYNTYSKKLLWSKTMKTVYLAYPAHSKGQGVAWRKEVTGSLLWKNLSSCQAPSSPCFLSAMRWAASLCHTLPPCPAHLRPRAMELTKHGLKP